MKDRTFIGDSCVMLVTLWEDGKLSGVGTEICDQHYIENLFGSCHDMCAYYASRLDSDSMAVPQRCQRCKDGE